MHYDDFIERACRVMDKYILRRPPSLGRGRRASSGRPRMQQIFQKFYLGSAADIAEYFFESEQMQAVVAATRHHRHLPRSARCRHRLRQALPLDGHGDRPSRPLGLRPRARWARSPRR